MTENRTKSLYPYDADAHFNGPAKICHAKISDVIKVEEKRLAKIRL